MDAIPQGECAKLEEHRPRNEPGGIVTFKGKVEKMKEKEKE